MTEQPKESLRSRIAARSPALFRKIIRMAEHYGRRHREWAQVLRDMRGASRRDQVILWTSALCAPVTALRRLDGCEPPKLFADIDVNIPSIGQFHVRAGTDDLINILPSRERHVQAVVDEFLGPGDTFVDAGANIGLYTAAASLRVGPSGAILAVEMIPETARILRGHLLRNGIENATVIEGALAEKGGDEVASFTPERKHGQASIATVNPPPRASTQRVKTLRLSDVLARAGPVSLMKMDLEGAELDALRGGGAALDQVAAIVFENNREDTRINELLEARGFTVRHLFGHDYLATRYGR